MHNLLGWIGGRIGAVSGSAIVFGVFTLTYGATPGEAMVEFFKNLPSWLTSEWFKLICVIVGIALIWISVKYNIWSQRQRAVDELAQMLSDGIDDLMNRHVTTDLDLGRLEADIRHWCERVLEKIDYYKAYFTRSDRIHFDRLGKVTEEVWEIAYRDKPDDRRHNHQLNILNIKFERLRDIINWTQQRTR